jgi:hypothetical protein
VPGLEAQAWQYLAITVASTGVAADSSDVPLGVKKADMSEVEVPLKLASKFL